MVFNGVIMQSVLAHNRTCRLGQERSALGHLVSGPTNDVCDVQWSVFVEYGLTVDGHWLLTHQSLSQHHRHCHNVSVSPSWSWRSRVSAVKISAIEIVLLGNNGPKTAAAGNAGLHFPALPFGPSYSSPVFLSCLRSAAFPLELDAFRRV